MAFDPDEYLKEKSSKFDPDEYLKESKKEDTSIGSKINSAARGLLQGASLGFADEISGALESAFTDKTYKQARDESRANFEAAKKENPSLYTVGDIGGSVGTMFIPGLNVAKGAQLGTVVANAALQGGISGIGRSEAEDTSGMFKDAAGGALLGGASGAAGYGIAKGIQKTPELIKNLSTSLAAKNLEITPSQFKNIGENIDDVTKLALKEDVISLNPFKTTQDKQEILRNYLLNKGQNLQQVRSQLPNIPQEEVLQAIQNRSINIDPRIVQNTPALNQIENINQTVRNLSPEGNINIKDLIDYKGTLGNMSRNSFGQLDSGVTKEALDAGRAALRDVEMKAAQNIPQYSSVLKDYSTGKTLENILENKLSRNMLSDIGLIGTVGGVGAGAGTGDPITGLGAAALLSRRGRNFSTGVGAKAFGALDNIITTLRNKSPEEVKQIIRNFTPELQSVILSRLSNPLGE
jgi:hypothetical protein